MSDSTKDWTAEETTRGKLVAALQEIHSIKVGFMHHTIKGDQFTKREADSTKWLINDIVADLAWIRAEIEHNHQP